MLLLRCDKQERPSLWANDAFFPYFRFPPLFRIFHSLGKFFQLFLKKLFFSHLNFWWPFLVIDSKFIISNLLSLKCCISPYFGNFVISPYFGKFPPDFVEFTCLFILYAFSPPTLVNFLLSSLNLRVFSYFMRFCSPLLW